METNSGLRPADVRQNNLASVLGVLRRGSATRSDLVAATGLTRSTMAGLVSELAELGLIDEVSSAATGRPGRPSPLVRLVPGAVAALGIDVSVTRLAVGLVGLDGRTISVVEREGDRTADSPESTAEAVAEMAQRIGVGGDGAPILVGVGAAVPGLVRGRDAHVVLAPNLGWTDVAFADLVRTAIHQRLGVLLDVSIGNEADLGAMAEARFGVGRRDRNVLYVHGDIGVGGSIVVDGARLPGASGYAGEIGHMPVNPNGGRCRCGSVGCWETEIGERVLLERAGLDPNSGNSGVKKLVVAAEGGEQRALDALAENGRWLGVGLAGLINILDPGLVVIGGLFGPLMPYMSDALDAELVARRFGPDERVASVVAAEMGTDALLIGAAELALTPALADPAGWLTIGG
ncbi:ROK family transcriptional regulator [Ilumatobacter nonamiensis]|uniref:ROK family transcriptional regulator n=1 Tax=Ilumatobacter nonamiensis TaxID=467093 RepID=UPI000348F929|nr:ROK family protein [Ilumatobacter nonamiensis]